MYGQHTLMNFPTPNVPPASDTSHYNHNASRSVSPYARHGYNPNPPPPPHVNSYDNSYNAPLYRPLPQTQVGIGSGRGYQKPQSITFTFKQKRIDKSGTLVDSQGNVLYKIVGERDQHDFSKHFQDYPSRIYRPDGSKVAKIDWDGLSKTIMKWASGGGKMPFENGILDQDYAFTLADGSRYEWDGVWGYVWRLLDHQTPDGSSLQPPICATFTPGNDNPPRDTAFEVLATKCNIPGLLDHLVVTSMWLEYVLLKKTEKEQLNQAMSNLSAAAGG